jgi:hypothetical protein
MGILATSIAKVLQIERIYTICSSILLCLHCKIIKMKKITIIAVLFLSIISISLLSSCATKKKYGCPSAIH